MTPVPLLGTVLVVEDDPEMGRLVVRGLRDEGYDAALVGDGVTALIEAASGTFSAVVLDVMLPGMNGFEVCRRIRDTDATLPVILLTARDAVDDRVKGLDSGADDYLTKPFAISELAARLRALRRREQSAPRATVTAGSLTIDLHAHSMTIGGEPVPVSPKEFAVLRMLVERLGETVARHDMLLEIWGSVDFTDANVVDQYVSYLRRKVDPERSGVSIQTIRGVGFRLMAEPE